MHAFVSLKIYYMFIMNNRILELSNIIEKDISIIQHSIKILELNKKLKLKLKNSNL